MPSIQGGRAGQNAESDRLSLDERTLCGDDERYSHDRPSADLSGSDGDHDILESEDERERLLTNTEGRSGVFGKPKVRIGSRKEKKASAGEGRSGKDSSEEREALMYEMEEGVGNSNSSLSPRSSDSDALRLSAATAQRKSQRSRTRRRLTIYAGISVLFVLLLSSAYQVSTPKPKPPTAAMVSNGTSLFAPTTILISLDGFRADFLYRGITPTLSGLVEDGISPKYMLPSFPSLTFPNHYTMVTGLYPESHGIVSNNFWDPTSKEMFTYHNSTIAMQPFWWGGEPLWATAERQNVRAAVHMWPGSEVHGDHLKPTYMDEFNQTEALAQKVRRVLGLLDLAGPMDPGANASQPRPQLIAAYVPDIDSVGHTKGPNSTEIRKTIGHIDDMLGSLLLGLRERNLTDIVNVVVVSDHGMATTDIERLIQLEDLVDLDEMVHEHVDGWPLVGLRPKVPADLPRMHQELVEKAKGNPAFNVYLRDKDMPERYHFSNNERIAPLWIVPKAGWAIPKKSEFPIEKCKKLGKPYHPRGLHGYDHEHPLMRAIFVARGPGFPHKPNSRVEPFQNIELYNIICDSIGIDPVPNNGTLRLPLKPVGLHNDTEAPNEIPADPPVSPKPLATMTMTSFSSLAASASGLKDFLSSIQDTDPVSTSTTSAPPAASSPAKESWWEWLSHKADKVEDWVEDLLHKNKKVPGEGKGTASE